MTRKYSGEFSHNNYSSLFCEVFDSSGNFCALFHYRVYFGRPAISVDNISLSPGLLRYELSNFIYKATIACSFPSAPNCADAMPDKFLF